MTDEGIFEACPAFGQRVDVGCLDNRVSVATKRAGCLIVREEEDDVGAVVRAERCSPGNTSDQEEHGADLHLGQFRVGSQVDSTARSLLAGSLRDYATTGDSLRVHRGLTNYSEMQAGPCRDHAVLHCLVRNAVTP